MIVLDKTIKTKKAELLSYFRDRANESMDDIRQTYGVDDYKSRARAINTAILETKTNLIKTCLQKAKKEEWSNKDILESILMITYTSYVVMIESRNDVWKYDYMTFSRRIGELWEPFCKLCFEHPINNLELFVPPLFSEVKAKLTAEIDQYIDSLNISPSQKSELKRYYSKVWSLVTSGEIKLELDLHFIQDNRKYVVDFKSGFGSNEKGNTNRLLLVASIYENTEEEYQCVLFVRAEEESNNNYFKTLKNSEIWDAYCGRYTYDKIHEFSGFDIMDWISTNIDWNNDFNSDTIEYLKENDLDQYLKW